MKNTCAKLDYPDFINYVREHIIDYIGGRLQKTEIVRVEIAPMMKNNETVTDALQIYEKGPRKCPMISLDDFYDEYCMGEELPEIMQSIAKTYENSREQEYFITPEELACFERMKHQIVIRLVSLEKNSHLLEVCPYRIFIDMAMTYRVLSGKTAGGISTVLVTQSMMEGWGITEPVLYELALENSVRLFPPRFKNMTMLISEMQNRNNENDSISNDICEESCYDGSLFVGTNDCGINGASILCYPDVFKDFAEKAGSDFYILPSSIHEVILLSVKANISPDTLASMVSGANRNMIAKDEYLSDSIYHYSAREGKIEKYSGQMYWKLLQ